MKVNIPDTPEMVSEMVDTIDEPEIGFVTEMAREPAKLKDFGFSDEVVARAEDLKVANDGDVEFPIIRTEEGWSDSGRLWDGAALQAIAEQTNSLMPVGHLGHIPDDQIATAMPDPQTTWIGAYTKVEPSKHKDRKGQNVTVLYTAGSNLPGAKVRMMIKNKAVRGTSWWAKAKLTPVPGKGVHVKDLHLLAIDWARKGSEGMPTSRIVAMAREMSEGGNMAEIDLAQVSPEQFKEKNPNGYALLVRQVEDEHKEIVAEMTKKVDEGEQAKSLIGKICEAIGVNDGDDLLEAVKTLHMKVGAKAKAMVDNALATLLEERVPDEEKRKVVARLLPVGEMVSACEDAASEDDVQKIVAEMTDKAIEKDDILPQLVSEQSAPVIRRREQLANQHLGGNNNPYMADRGGRPVTA